MTEKRKISIRKVLQAVVTLLVTVCCVVAMVGASKIEDKKLLKSIAVHIKNDKKYHFIEQRDVLQKAFGGREDIVMQTPLGKIDLYSMERNIKADPWVATAEVYIDKDKVLNIYVTQRIPIARLFDQGGNSYYIDTSLHNMPLSPTYKYYTAVITNVPVFNNDSTAKSIKAQIALMVKTIQADSFWSLQVSQVVFDSGNNFELVPLIGNQQIIFGDTSRMKEKFANLFHFYKSVLNKIGWDRYEKLDLRFCGQVVASPALPYNAPAVKDNLSFIKSIEEIGARDEMRDSIKLADAKEKQDVKNNKDKNTDTKKVKEPGKPAKDTKQKAKPPEKPGKKDSGKENKKPGNDKNKKPVGDKDKKKEDKKQIENKGKKN